MTQPNSSKATSAGGCFIAALVPAGAIIGGMLGQPSLGMLAGLVLGAAVAVAIWLREPGQ